MIGASHELVKAVQVDAMPTSEEEDGVPRVEDELVLPTDGANGLEALLDTATMRVTKVDVETDVTRVTVPVVNP